MYDNWPSSFSFVLDDVKALRTIQEAIALVPRQMVKAAEAGDGLNLDRLATAYWKLLRTRRELRQRVTPKMQAAARKVERERAPKEAER